MKENTLIEMKNKVDAMARVMQQLITEIQFTREVAVGSLETIKKMPGYDEALEQLKSEVTEKPSEKQPVQCYPRDTLSAADLLPRDAASSPFAQVNPAGQGNSDGQNFLTAGSLIGIDTVGQSLRNANQQLRSEPPNPQVKVSPWMQTTINPDLSRRALE